MGLFSNIFGGSKTEPRRQTGQEETAQQEQTGQVRAQQKGQTSATAGQQATRQTGTQRSSGTTRSDQSRNQTQRETGTQSTQSRQSGRQSTREESTTTQRTSGSSTERRNLRRLNEETEQFLTQLLPQIAGGENVVDENTIRALSDAINVGRTAQDRAVGGDQEIQQAISGILQEARRQQESQLQRTTAEAAAVAGSSLNTAVSGQAGRQRGELETRLAGLEGQLTLQGREQITNELASAAGILQSAASQQAGIALEQRANELAAVQGIGNVLKGAIETGTINRSFQQTSISDTIRDAVQRSSQTTDATTRSNVTSSLAEQISGVQQTDQTVATQQDSLTENQQVNQSLANLVEALAGESNLRSLRDVDIEGGGGGSSTGGILPALGSLSGFVRS